MSDIGKPERAMQDRVVALFHAELGYRCLGDWATGATGAASLTSSGLVTMLAKASQLEQVMMQELLTGRTRQV
jgi:type I restriction enzyme R subunit